MHCVDGRHSGHRQIHTNTHLEHFNTIINTFPHTLLGGYSITFYPSICQGPKTHRMQVYLSLSVGVCVCVEETCVYVCTYHPHASTRVHHVMSTSSSRNQQDGQPQLGRASSRACYRRSGFSDLVRSLWPGEQSSVMCWRRYTHTHMTRLIIRCMLNDGQLWALRPHTHTHTQTPSRAARPSLSVDKPTTSASTHAYANLLTAL